MTNLKSQQGVGLIEVLVALVILAIGVLGFSALQLRAMQATTEATDRTMAMNLARDLAERIRINRLGLSDYVTAINSSTNTAVTSCVGSTVTYKPGCSAEIMAKYDVSDIKAKATEKGQTVIMKQCDGSTRTCIYVSWGKTTMTADNVGDCMTSGSYMPDAQCIVMEAF